MGNVRTTGNALNGSAIHRTRRPGQDEIATIYRRMAAVRYQNDTKPDGAGLEKEKRSQDDERMIEPEARRKTKVRNTIVCKAVIRRKKRRKDYKRARLYRSDRLPELIIGFIDMQCYSNLQNEYYLLY